MLVKDIVARAQETVGWNGSDDRSYEEGLKIAVADLNRSEALGAQGAMMMEQLYIGQLANRFRADKYAAEHPEVLKEEIKRPVIIVGATRTGSTMTSHILGADHNRRSLLKWEGVNGIPPATTETLRTDPRCVALNESEALAFVPEKNDPKALELRQKIDAIHHEDADDPTECTIILAFDFWSAMVESLCPMPIYRDWLLLHSPTDAYRFHKRYLQILQSKAPGTWSLKGPTHALGIDTMLKTYPDARVIWTHRDPYKVMGSHCSLIKMSQMLFGVTDNLRHIREYYPRQIAEHVLRPMRAEMEGRLHPGNCYHLYYENMRHDPIAEIRKVYAWLGDDFSPDVEKAMRGWLAARPQNKFGRHEYSIADFGLTQDDLKPYFAEYLARYPVKLEGKY